MRAFPIFYIVVSATILNAIPLHAQQKIFEKKLSNQIQTAGTIISITQDPQGYMWFGSQAEGLTRYDGFTVTSLKNNPQNTNSIASNWVEVVFIDSRGIFWLGVRGSGLDRYDPVQKKFTHYRHNVNDTTSLSNDTVTAIIEDKSGNLWVGTHKGLNLLDKKTGRFTHHYNSPNDSTSLSYDDVRVLYEDRQGTVWVGCGSTFFSDGGKPEDGGLNKYNPDSKKFTRYLHDPNNKNSIESNKVSALFEDSKGNFWVGTAGDGLHTLDRTTGIFTHYYYDSTRPGKLSRPPVFNFSAGLDLITFLHEDVKGFLWIGTFRGGINQYNPSTKNVTHHGYMVKQNQYMPLDTLTGYNNRTAFRAFTSKEGLTWISGFAEVYIMDPYKKAVIPYVAITEKGANTFYEEKNGSLWLGTDNGLFRKDINTGKRKKYSNDTTVAIQVDNKGTYWLGTFGSGLTKFNPETERSTSYKNDGKEGSLSSNNILNLFLDNARTLWIATDDAGLNKYDIEKNTFTQYQHNSNDSSSLNNNTVSCITQDHKSDIWVATNAGVSKLNKAKGNFANYNLNTIVNNVFVDNKGIIWAGGVNGLYRYDQLNNQFILFTGNNGFTKINKVLNIIEDNQNNLWLSTTNAICRIGADRSGVRLFGKEYGVHTNLFAFANNYKTRNGTLLLGDVGGYYALLPENFTPPLRPPQINITSFQLRNEEVTPGEGKILADPIYAAEKISLSHDQNSFSFGFSAIQYTGTGEISYEYMLENYDNVWHDAGAANKAYFFNIIPGDYVFHVRAINSDGEWSVKKLLVVVSAPWWQTWWAIIIFIVSFIGVVSLFFYYRSQRLRKENKLLEYKVKRRTSQLHESLEELKATQSQLVQREKMASLGELTAGIAHEIQNPLNFVNNFSEINKELLGELNDALEKGNIDEVKIIANDIIDNEQKINYHGKRADAIVKGMLQHSQASTGNKEPTNINALADEYLKLSYHGMRAKNKNFNTDIKTAFGENIGKIEIVAGDIGRVLINLFNNAFYAVNEKKKQLNGTFEPLISVTTERSGDTIKILVKDNGTGIPKKAVEKIFQPFFTTKPSGEGTGLGLSLSYEIIKAHGGHLQVKSTEGEGVEFTILLPTK